MFLRLGNSSPEGASGEGCGAVRLSGSGMGEYTGAGVAGAGVGSAGRGVAGAGVWPGGAVFSTGLSWARAWKTGRPAAPASSSNESR